MSVRPTRILVGFGMTVKCLLAGTGRTKLALGLHRHVFLWQAAWASFLRMDMKHLNEQRLVPKGN